MRKFTAILLFAGLISAALSCQKGPAAEEDDFDPDAPVSYTLTQKKSAKRGMGFNNPFQESDGAQLGPGVSWAYNWSNRTPSDELYASLNGNGINFVPMLWNGNWSADNIKAIKSQNPDLQYILAFNEPNLTDQANMTPAQAAALWGDVVAIARETGLKIISPALNYGTLAGYNDPVKWMDEFLAQPGVSLDQMDGIALHCYMPSASSVSSFLDKFQKYGKPLWLTEFCNGNSNNISEETQLGYMCETLNMLEGRDDVAAYAWFMMRGGFNSQWHNNLVGSASPFELTTLGKVFVNFSTFDKGIYYAPRQIIPAEQYVAAGGQIRLQPSTDGGVLDISRLSKDAWVEYQLDVPQAGSYTLYLRFQTFADAGLRFSLDGAEIAAKKIPNTSKVWTTSHFGIELPAGKHVIRLTCTSGSPLALNWITIR